MRCRVGAEAFWVIRRVQQPIKYFPTGSGLLVQLICVERHVGLVKLRAPWAKGP